MQLGLPSTGFVIVVKRECETCRLLLPALRELAASRTGVLVCSQDDPAFPAQFDSVLDDTELAHSFALNIEAVPTLIRFVNGKETSRCVSWVRDEWRAITGLPLLGETLPAMRIGCGSKSREPGVAEHLAARYGVNSLHSRTIALGPWDDPVDACYDRGWTDGLPVVPPTDDRVLRMLGGTKRNRDEVIGLIPPNLAPCTVEKVAINAVMAGCRPEYMPLLLGILQACLDPLFSWHGLICTTWFSGPVIIVNGPVTRQLGMNSGINALGPGNRANATIGRAVQLISQNIGGGRAGGIDRATLGGPGKYTCCFAEDESDPDWVPLSVSRGIAPGKSAVTLFQGEGVQPFMDQRSRTPEELSRSLAAALFTVGHPKICEANTATLLLSPEHYAIFCNAGWGRKEIEQSLRADLRRPGKDVIIGAGGIGEGMPTSRENDMVDKFWPDELLIVRAGGQAGLFSGILSGWGACRSRESCRPVTMELTIEYATD